MGFIAIYFHAGFEVDDYAVNAYPDKPLALQVIKELAVMAFSGFNQRGKQGYFFLIKSVLYQPNDLLIGIANHALVRLVAVGRSDTCIQQPYKIVELGNCPYRRAGIFGGGFLFDGNHGGQTIDFINFWTFEVAQKLTNISRKGFHIPALALGIQGVKC